MLVKLIVLLEFCQRHCWIDWWRLLRPRRHVGQVLGCGRRRWRDIIWSAFHRQTIADLLQDSTQRSVHRIQRRGQRWIWSRLLSTIRLCLQCDKPLLVMFKRSVSNLCFSICSIAEKSQFDVDFFSLLKHYILSLKNSERHLTLVLSVQKSERLSVIPNSKVLAINVFSEKLMLHNWGKNLKNLNLNVDFRSPPLMIEIPVRTLKNVIVAVRDCFTGNLVEAAAVVTVPEDAPR